LCRVGADLPDKETWDSHQIVRRERLHAMLTAARDELDLGETVAPIQSSDSTRDIARRQTMISSVGHM
jgi:hypothetical protein